MAGEQQTLTPETAAAVFEEQMDDNGFLPGDEDYEGPEPVEEESEEVVDPEVDSNDGDTEDETESD